MRYEESVAALADSVGSRNQTLLGVVLRGFHEMVPIERIADDLATKAGDPPLTAQEIQRAITRAKEFATGNPAVRWEAMGDMIRKAEAARLECSDEDRAFVPTMIARGRDAAVAAGFKVIVGSGYDEIGPALSLTSPMTREDIAAFGMKSDWQNFACAFIRTVWPDDTFNVFTTNDIRAARSRERICHPSELYRQIVESNADGVCGNWGLPSHCCPNQYSGAMKRINGKESYANKDVIATRRLALVEFDALSLKDQAAFWLGAVTTGSLRVRSIVYTRNKSLHGLVRVEEEQPIVDMFGEVTPTDKRVAEQKWDNNWTILRRKMCSAEDPAMRCDSACRDASRMTRFPGGLRGYLNHSLVWCAKPNKEDDVKKTNGKEWF